MCVKFWLYVANNISSQMFHKTFCYSKFVFKLRYFLSCEISISFNGKRGDYGKMLSSIYMVGAHIYANLDGTVLKIFA